MKHYYPAIPTILTCCYLALDFNEILNQLYLAILVVYPAITLLLILAVITAFIITKKKSHPITLSFFLLLTGAILLPALEVPVSAAIRELTSWNRVFVVSRDTYEAEDTFEFTITGHGEGSYSTFTLTRGYTNIGINGDYRNGPSLYYKLQPELKIRTTDGYTPLTKGSLSRAFHENKLSSLADTSNQSAYLIRLRKYSLLSSREGFAHRLGNVDTAELHLTPDENTVYRFIFFIIAFLSLVVCTMVNWRQRNFSGGT